MDINARVERMDEELKLVKNEIKQVLLEIQEQVLNAQNPFTSVIVGPDTGRKGDSPETVRREPPAATIDDDLKLLKDEIKSIGDQVRSQEPSGSQAPFPTPPNQAWPGPGAPTGFDFGPYQAPAPPVDAGRSIRSEGPMAQPADAYASERQGAGRPPVQEERPAGRPVPTESDQAGDPFVGRERPEVAGALPGADDERAEDHPGDRQAVQGISFAEAERESPKDESDRGRAEQPPPGRKSDSNSQASSSNAARDPKVMELVTIAGLAQWADQVLKKGGKDYVEALLDVSVMTGRLPEELKGTLLTLVRVLGEQSTGRGITAKETVRLLAQLDGLLGISTSSDARLMSILFQDDLEAFP